MTDRHDATVDRLAGLLRHHFRRDPEVTVCERAHWQPMEEFPEYAPLFDVLVVRGPVRSRQQAGRFVLANETHPTVAIDVLTRDTLYDDFYDKTDALSVGGAYEYVLIDPTSEWMRPNLQARRKSDSGFQLVSTTADGVFFSYSGFRLSCDASGAIDLAASGPHWHEETVFDGERKLNSLLASGASERIVAATGASIAEAKKRLAERKRRRR